ncbi:unnamed protein product [Urochloa decumbens]|uniref:Uncharacterized protein n=1 Tax=Urochloa decumbens TaxID=240449 RepID=A0ABC8XNN8_9POAL
MSTGGSCSTPSSAAKDRSVALSELLEHIHGYYKAALDRLPVEETPALIPRLLDGGVCFGLLDPVSNIIANTVRSFEPLPETHAAEEPAAAEEGERSRRGAKRKAAAEEEARMIRDEAMSEIATDAGSIYCLPPILRDARMRRKKRTVAQRSLESRGPRHVSRLLLPAPPRRGGPALPPPRQGRSCPISSPTTEIALRCAAIAASHPAPANLADRSLSLASRLDQVPQLLTIDDRLSPDAINRLYHKLLEAPVIEQLAVSPKPLQLATVRLNRCIKGNSSLERFPLEFTKILRYLLLHKIHALYLKAIALLPRDALRRRHHRGPLKAGCCFGPADNPVTNIILNTIWYDTAFPSHVQFEVDVISTKSLGRIECRSLNGLLALLGNLFPALSEHEAMVHLLRSNASLQDLILRAMQNQDMSSGSYEAAYKAAAEAARHPQPDAQAEFSMSTSPKTFHIVESALRINRTLKLSEVELITSYFSQKSYPGKSVTSVPKSTPHATKIVSYNKRNFLATQDFIRRKVEAALQKYGKEKGIEYELHIICGVNLDVPENGKHSYILNEEGYPYSHVNFLARPKGCHLDDMAPNLLFLECSNDENGLDGLSSCCTVLVSPSDSGRCFHCEYEGIKIVHPDFGTYRGRETDFEEMTCGERKVDNEQLISFGKMRMEFVGIVSDDSVYSDPATDADFAECLNYLARREQKEEAFLSGECSR